MVQRQKSVAQEAFVSPAKLFLPHFYIKLKEDYLKRIRIFFFFFNTEKKIITRGQFGNSWKLDGIQKCF